MMKRLLLIVIPVLAFCSPGRASISRGGNCSGTTSCTPSTSAAFQLELAFSVRAGSTVAPTLPVGWTSILTATGTASSVLAACRVEYSATAAGSGTFTNATNTGIGGYKGTGARAIQDCATNGVAIGASASSSGSSTTPSCPALTLTNGGGTSWVVCGVFNAGGSGSMCTPAGLSNIAGATTGDVGFFDTNGTVSSFSAATCTNGTSQNWIAVTVEIIVPPSNPPSLTQLVNGDGGMGIRNGDANPGNNFRRKIDPTGAGNTEIISLGYTRSASRTLTITDDKGDTATKVVSCDDVSAVLSFAVYYIQNLTAGATVLNFVFDGNVNDFSEMHHQFSGLPSTIVLDGTATCAVNVGLGGANTLGNLADATGVTTTTSGDLIYNASFNEGVGNFESNNSIFDIVFGSGYTGLMGDLAWGSAAQAQIQSSSGLIKPSLMYAQTSFDVYAIMTAAFKTSGGAGTARSTGKIVRMINSGIQGTVLTQNLVLPCDAGNFINISFENNSGTSGINVTSVVTEAGDTWASQNPGGTNFPQYWNVTNATCNGQVFGVITGGSHSAETRYTIYELSGALTSSALDVPAQTSATFTFNAATTLGAAVTSAGQTAWTLAAAGGIANGDFLLASTEVVKVTAGGGTTSITVTRGQFGTTALGSIANGSNVFDSLQTPQPNIVTAQANEVAFCSMNQGLGPNFDTVNATNDFGYFPGMNDQSRYANGDDNCHAYEPSAGTVPLGWYVANQAQTGNTGNTSVIAVKLQSTGIVISPSKQTKLGKVDP